MDETWLLTEMLEADGPSESSMEKCNGGCTQYCLKCDGTGILNGESCYSCGGTGWRR